MKILLTGATGFIGRHIAAALWASGHTVVPVSRVHGIDFMQLTQPDDWRAYLNGIDAVINSVGIIAETRQQRFAELHFQAPAALFRACAQAGVKRVIQISALGADEHAVTPYHVSKKTADEVLRSLPLDWFVLRPSLVYGPGGKSTHLFQTLASLPVIPLVGNGQQQLQPVHIDDLVATVLICLSAATTRRTIDVVGPQVMTLVEWLQRLRQQTGRAATKTLAIPLSLMMMSTRFLKTVYPLLSPDNLRMLQQGNMADVQPLVQWLGRMPRVVP